MNKFLREGYFSCVLCDDLFTRKSNVQKYCPKCKSWGKHLTERAYYCKHSAHIRREKKKRLKAARTESTA